MYKKMPPGHIDIKEKQGFTLVEVAIMLVIIGLLVGGVLVGRDLIRAAEFRATIADFEKFEAAFNTYRLKFNAIPGDDANATAYFGAQTTNGNGDGRIYDHYSAISPDEDAKAWQHLSLASLIPLSPFTSLYPHVVGKNMPAAHVGGAHAGYRFQSAPGSEGAGTIFYYNDRQGIRIRLGTDQTTTDLSWAVLTPQDAMIIDTKIDDGKPATGKMTGEAYGADWGLYPYDACDTGSTAFIDPGSNTYKTTNTGIGCALNWWIM
jgi:type II secretory pathway pseudopilin PulG